MSEDTHIEVYEWEEGEPRPGSETKLSGHWIDNLAIPSGGQIPQRGDVLNLWKADEVAPTRYVVIERELLWFRTSKDDAEKASPWMKMWIHVRRVSDYSEPAI